MCPNLEECRKGVLADLFGTEQISEIIFDELTLPRHPGNDLPQKKVLSMAKSILLSPQTNSFITLLYWIPPKH